MNPANLRMNPEAAESGTDRPLVFISYASEDVSLAEKIEYFLSPAGDNHEFDVFRDAKDIDGGDDFDQVIRNELERCDVAIVLVSVDYFNSSYIKKVELPFLKERNQGSGLIVLPLRVRGTFDELIPVWINQLNFISRKDEIPNRFPEKKPIPETALEVFKALVKEVVRAVEKSRTSTKGGAPIRTGPGQLLPKDEFETAALPKASDVARWFDSLLEQEAFAPQNDQAKTKRLLAGKLIAAVWSLTEQDGEGGFFKKDQIAKEAGILDLDQTTSSEVTKLLVKMREVSIIVPNSENGKKYRANPRAPTAGKQEGTPPQTAREFSGLPEQDLEAMKAFYDSGASIGKVASVWGMPHERVKELFLEQGIRLRSDADSKALRKRVEQEEVGLSRETRKSVLDAVKAGESIEKISDERGVGTKIIWAAIRSAEESGDLKPSQVKGLIHHGTAKYSDEELLGMLREAASAEAGKLTAKEFTNYGRSRVLADGRSWPTHQTPMKRFGSWVNALRAAGLPANKTAGPDRKFTENDCVQAVQEVGYKLGKGPSVNEYDAIAQASGGRLPSVATVRKRVGSWTKALSKAGW